MELVYQTVTSHPNVIYTNGNSAEKNRETLQNIIDWFAEKEQYEYCQKLKEIQDACN